MCACRNGIYPDGDIIMLPDLSFLLYDVVLFTVIYACFPRQSKNLILNTIPKLRREYVVVHFRKMATKTPLIYFVIPDSKTGFAKIEKGQYDLRRENALPDIPLFKNRLHFLVDEGDSIPVRTTLTDLDQADVLYKYKGNIFFNSAVGVKETPHTKEAFKFWAFRVDSAFKSIAYDFIFGEKRQWAFIFALFACLVALGIAVYAVLEIQHMKPLVDTIYSRTILGNETLVIKGK